MFANYAYTPFTKGECACNAVHQVAGLNFGRSVREVTTEVPMRGRFGEALAGARRAKRITLRKLGQLVGMAPSFLSELENGRKSPPRDEEKIKDLELILGVEEGKLLELARQERSKKRTQFIDRLFQIAPETALGLCRVSEEEEDDEKLIKAFKQMVSKLEEKK